MGVVTERCEGGREKEVALSLANRLCYSYFDFSQSHRTAKHFPASTLYAGRREKHCSKQQTCGSCAGSQYQTLGVSTSVTSTKESGIAV